MARIHVTTYADATGRLKEIYNDLLAKRGKLADIHQIQSLRPESIVKHMELYMEIMFSRSELSRSEREMLAVVVSIANGCAYCQSHHEMALKHYVKDATKLNAIRSDFNSPVLSEREKALCGFAQHLTLAPASHEENDHTRILHTIGLSDAAILDVVLVVAYFNFVNRIALSLGLEMNNQEISGYKY
jgi:uncharacterized peroxidase-related enzyme